jgi:16S rRNA C1402 (ribose-2'-O) methylase RsmI
VGVVADPGLGVVPGAHTDSAVLAVLAHPCALVVSFCDM